MRKTRLLTLLLLLMTAVTGAVAQTTYSITVKEGTEDAANWSATPSPAEEGQTVTINYAGTKSVKSVTAKRKTTTGNFTVYFTDALNYGDVHVYFWYGDSWPGTAMTFVKTNEYNQKIYRAEIPTTAVGIIFNGNGRQTVDIIEDIADGSWWYTKDEFDEQGHNKVAYINEYTENIDVTNVDANNWTFTMPDYNVELDIEYYPAHPVTISDGDKDAANWSATPTEQSFGQNVTLQYTGRKKIKTITIEAAAPAATDLSTINANYTASNGETLTGTLASNVQISIADGATVTLNNVNINGTNDDNYKWAGITCEGDATIILSGTNTVKGFYENYPGIYVPGSKTVTIKGSGSLTASSNGWGAGIGGGWEINCGNIEIQGGTITATGGEGAAGIGSGRPYGTSCGTITISGGTVTATGGGSAAGIGSGTGASCGAITITSGVTSVTATKGSNASNSIGAGVEGTCGTVTIEDPSKVTEN